MIQILIVDCLLDGQGDSHLKCIKYYKLLRSNFSLAFIFFVKVLIKTLIFKTRTDELDENIKIIVRITYYYV